MNQVVANCVSQRSSRLVICTPYKHVKKRSKIREWLHKCEKTVDHLGTQPCRVRAWRNFRIHGVTPGAACSRPIPISQPSGALPCIQMSGSRFRHAPQSPSSFPSPSAARGHSQVRCPPPSPPARTSSPLRHHFSRVMAVRD